MGIGTRIKMRRIELGLSLRDLAKKMGYKNHSTIVRIENNDIDVPHSRIIQFASVLGVPVEYLMELDDTPSTNEDIQPLTLGETIKQTRLAKGLTQAELSNLLGIQQSSMAKYENGRVLNLKPATLLKISEILNIPIAELFSSISTELSSTTAEDDSNYNIQSKKPDILLRLDNDVELLEIVQMINALTPDKLILVKNILNAFSK